jgi:putative ABC transport system permease protein
MASLLLVGAGLLVRTMVGLLAVTPGFHSSGLLTAQVVLGGHRYQADRPADAIAAVTRFYDDVLSRLRGLPMVEHASATTTLPLGGGFDQHGLHIAGRLHANPEEAPDTHRFVVQTDFFETLRIPLVRGRLLTRQDSQGAPLVVVINRTTADQLFPGEDPIGHRIMLGPPDAPARTIVGVVADIRHLGLDQPPGFQVYAPQAQWAWGEGLMTLVVKGTGDPASLAGVVRQAVRDVDPAQPVADIRVYDEVVAETIGTRRFASWLLVSFAGVTVLVALVGLYGALGVVVGLRRREIGIRLALGASAAGVRRMILAQGMRPVAFGLIFGLTTASLAVTALRSLLFGVETRDPITFTAVAVLLLLSSLAACAGPAWRAARVDPAVTLRSE